MTQLCKMKPNERKKVQNFEFWPFLRFWRVEKSRRLKKSSSFPLVSFVTLWRCSSQLLVELYGQKIVCVLVSLLKSFDTSRGWILLIFGLKLDIDKLRKITEPDYPKKIWFLIKKIKRAFLGTLCFLNFKLLVRLPQKHQKW